MKINTLQILYGSATLALIAGIGLTVASLRQATSLAQSLRGRVAVVAELQAMERAKDRYSAAVRRFEALSNTAPVSLSGLAAATVTNATPDIREIESKPLDQGWVLIRSEVIFNDLNLDQLPAFAHAVESQRPPWRLVECSITASTQTDGFGRVVLILEALSKQAK
ncbi:MAG: hypothetical protein KKG09_08820 [Verrucomicrobia bacterium]|nr:hypothetical protein [Verrucomicrobiota bacterium]MBU4246960.1 hypothetical protein [Verrucomicrobiota bacterium]MBU4291332.1 hypothetical protein [Verrucomicrobiota bacterium]MBU4498091.1 hypothetical protein [Verrucomicrobiota bacterium]MCG2680034.1 hypothetical protein [Kiritimatiellia bacterium]